MKTKLVLSISIVIAGNALLAQDKWDTDGNNGVGNNAKIGPKNNKGFNIITNNQTTVDVQNNGTFNFLKPVNFTNKVKFDSLRVIRYLDVDSIHCRTIKVGNSWTVNDAGPSYGATRPFNQQTQNSTDRNHVFEGGAFFQPVASRDNVKAIIGYLSSSNGAFHRLNLHSEFSNDVFESFSNRTLYGLTNSFAATDGFKVGILANGTAQLNQQENLDMQFFTNNLQRAVIKNTGFVGINTNTPNDQVEINSTLLSAATVNGGPTDPLIGTAPTGKSGLTFTDLTSTSIPQDNPSGNVLAVDATGKVVLVKDRGTGGTGGTSPSKNGLNSTVGAPDIELGGPLIRQTNVTMNNVGGTKFDMVFNGNGQFGVGNNLLAGVNLGADSKMIVRADNTVASPFNRAFEAKFVGTTFIPNNTFGGYFQNNSQALSSTGVYGEAYTDSYTANGFKGLVYPVNAGTIGDGFGIHVTVNDAINSTGGYFEARALNNGGGTSIGVQAFARSTTPVNTGVLGICDGASSQNYGGNFESRNGPKIAPAYNIGVRGIAEEGGFFNSNVGSNNFGLWGMADNALVSAFGVIGTLQSFSFPSTPAGVGAGVYGTSNQSSGTMAQQFAGYFDGNVHINGNLTVSGTFPIPSDQNLKTNIATISNAKQIISQLQPKHFYFDSTKYFLRTQTKKQYGFLAQDVETILPELVNTYTIANLVDSLGNVTETGGTYKNLNYNAFIAILIANAKEQQHAIDSLTTKLNAKDSLQDARLAALENAILQCCSNNATRLGNTNNASLNQLDIELSDKDAIVLNQNVPNPFAEQTTIMYNVPSKVEKAQILFYNAAGQIIQTVDIKTRGKGKVNVFASDLSSGLYHYTLVADGVVIDSKKMVRE